MSTTVTLTGDSFRDDNDTFAASFNEGPMEADKFQYIGRGGKFSLARHNQFIFNGSVLPDDAVIESAFFEMESTAAQEGSDGVVQIHEMLRDGIWDTRGANSPAAEWRGSHLCDMTCAVRFDLSSEGGGSNFEGFRQTGGADPPATSSITNLPWRDSPILSGHSVAATQELGEYAHFNNFGSAIPVNEIAFWIGKTSSSLLGTVWVELWTAKTGGGGQHNFEPDTLVTNGVSIFKQWTSVGIGVAKRVFTFTTKPVLDLGTTSEYVMKLRSSNSIDGVEWPLFQVKGRNDGINNNFGTPVDGNALALGQDHGLTYSNYLDMVNGPIAQFLPNFAWSLPNIAGSGVVLNTDDQGIDLEPIVTNNIARANWNDDKLIGLFMLANGYPDTSSTAWQQQVRPAGAFANPKLIVTFESGRTRSSGSP